MRPSSSRPVTAMREKIAGDNTPRTQRGNGSCRAETSEPIMGPEYRARPCVSAATTSNSRTQLPHAAFTELSNAALACSEATAVVRPQVQASTSRMADSAAGVQVRTPRCFTRPPSRRDTALTPSMVGASWLGVVVSGVRDTSPSVLAAVACTREHATATQSRTLPPHSGTSSGLETSSERSHVAATATCRRSTAAASSVVQDRDGRRASMAPCSWLTMAGACLPRALARPVPETAASTVASPLTATRTLRCAGEASICVNERSNSPN
mmetsp:Transcript_6075/g.15006  ORF Transcript_6075/g.15006 Transcript_6075/m.15006 type:complete len:268 (+) Transcript_6075:127-930(+)